MSTPPAGLAARAGRLLARIEDGLLAALLCGLIALSTAQILLRNVFDSGLAWTGPVLRHGVLWLGLMGALGAARTSEHIAIDALTRALPPRARALADALASAFTASVCGLVAYHAARLVGMDRAAGSLAFGAVPAWCVESIIPLSFAGMALRFALRVPRELRQTLREGAPPS